MLETQISLIYMTSESRSGFRGILLNIDRRELTGEEKVKSLSVGRVCAVASIQSDCRGPVWSTGLKGMKLSRVLDARQGLGPWVNGAAEDSI